MSIFFLLFFGRLIYRTHSVVTISGCHNSCRCSDYNPSSGELCLFRCDLEEEACKQATLYCDSGNPCTLQCNQDSSCREVRFIATDATDVTITCGTSGSEECESANFDCGTGICSVDCSGDCSGISVDIQPSTQEFQCTSGCPTSVETLQFTPSPTPSPTYNPTPSPTFHPTQSPTNIPTLSPTPSPTNNPTPAPTNIPTNIPTSAAPTLSTSQPSKSPTKPPTPAPTTNPTPSPTPSPTTDPTPAPTINPTPSPTYNPTASPTNIPTNGPTTHSPTFTTLNPSVTPTVAPTVNNEGHVQSGDEPETTSGVGDGTGDDVLTQSNTPIFASYIYMIIGFGATCCCLSLCVLLIRRRNKKRKEIMKAFDSLKKTELKRIQSLSGVQIANDLPFAATYTQTNSISPFASVELATFDGNKTENTGTGTGTYTGTDSDNIADDTMHNMLTPMGPSVDDIVNNINNSVQNNIPPPPPPPPPPKNNDIPIFEGSPMYTHDNNVLLQMIIGAEGDDGDDDSDVDNINNNQNEDDDHDYEDILTVINTPMGPIGALSDEVDDIDNQQDQDQDGDVLQGVDDMVTTGGHGINENIILGNDEFLIDEDFDEGGNTPVNNDDDDIFADDLIDLFQTPM